MSCTDLRPGNHDDHGDHEEVGGYMRKLEVVHKDVGGCLISYDLQLVSCTVACEEQNL